MKSEITVQKKVNKQEKGVQRALLFLIALGFLGIILTLALKGGGKAPGEAGRALKPGTEASQEKAGKAVKIARVGTTDIEKTIRVNGDIEAAESISVYSDVSGKITRILVSVGDTVKAGDVLALVNPSRPGEVYSDSPVLSTISGTITSLPFHTGDTVSTQTALAVVGKLHSLKITAQVPERYVTLLEKGVTAPVFLEAFPGESFTASIVEVSPVLDPASRTNEITLTFLLADPRIKSGMFASLSLPVERRTHALTVPRDAVVVSGEESYLFVVKDGQVEKKVVTTGILSDSLMEIREGVSEGEEIVIEGMNSLSSGTLVRILPTVEGGSL